MGERAVFPPRSRTLWAWTCATGLAACAGFRGAREVIGFPHAAAGPQRRDIVLELGTTLQSEGGHPAVPAIRFQPARWEQGYT